MSIRGLAWSTIYVGSWVDGGRTFSELSAIEDAVNKWLRKLLGIIVNFTQQKRSQPATRGFEWLSSEGS